MLDKLPNSKRKLVPNVIKDGKVKIQTHPLSSQEAEGWMDLEDVIEIFYRGEDGPTREEIKHGIEEGRLGVFGPVKI